MHCVTEWMKVETSRFISEWMYDIETTHWISEWMKVRIKHCMSEWMNVKTTD